MKGDRFVRAFKMGVRLGWLTPEQVQARTDAHYAQIDRNGGIDYRARAHNTRGWFEWERDMITRYFPSTGRVFVHAAGGGREVLALARAGYEVVGGECNPQLVAAANALMADEGVAARVAHIPAGAVKLQHEHYDAVIIGWGAYAHIYRRADRLTLLRALAAVMSPGAPLLLSFHYRDGSAFPFRLTSNVANLLRWARGRERVEVGDTLRRFFSHEFTREEATAEIRAGGFEPVGYGTADTNAHVIALRMS
jgi:2-polyprenyl-3-methyl-5-hydroxy-6-metoxy-1,4-benzoquinol methylase